jgi:integrase
MHRSSPPPRKDARSTSTGAATSSRPGRTSTSACESTSSQSSALAVSRTSIVPTYSASSTAHTTLSGSRVRSVVNAIRSLYRWAQERELVAHDPAALVRLPAINATPRDRVATPAEFAALLAALEIEDALPYGLAGYAMGRRAQIRRLRWRDVDLGIGAIEWGIEPDARKSRAAQRVVPTVKPMLTLLKRAWISQGRPPGDRLVCPPRRAKPTGLLHTGGLTARANEALQRKKLQPIGLHECRHTTATWLDAAGVSPKVASVLMGHATPDRQPEAAQITHARHTHVMPDAIESARSQLDSWFATQLSATATAG